MFCAFNGIEGVMPEREMPASDASENGIIISNSARMQKLYLNKELPLLKLCLFIITPFYYLSLTPQGALHCILAGNTIKFHLKRTFQFHSALNAISFIMITAKIIPKPLAFTAGFHYKPTSLSIGCPFSFIGFVKVCK